ncbi:MAG: hypothetical protein AAF411_02525 [Myxococcota bacterium]
MLTLGAVGETMRRKMGMQRHRTSFAFAAVGWTWSVLVASAAFFESLGSGARGAFHAALALSVVLLGAAVALGRPFRYAFRDVGRGFRLERFAGPIVVLAHAALVGVWALGLDAQAARWVAQPVGVGLALAGACLTCLLAIEACLSLRGRLSQTLTALGTAALTIVALNGLALASSGGAAFGPVLSDYATTPVGRLA